MRVWWRPPELGSARCWRRALCVLAVLALAPRATAPAARPCAANPLCMCRGDHLACDYVPFHRFPDTEASARHVSVAAARLVALGAAALDGRALRTLVLVDSRLHHVDPAAFLSMSSSLASLDLGYNEFTELPLGALRHLRVLNWLNLQNNYISDLDPELEWGGLAESLSTLSLSNNHISVVREGALASLRHLVSLELDGNRLRHLDAGALPPPLLALRLSDNLLTELPCGALALLPRLRHLHLRNNMLQPSSNGTCRNTRPKIDSLDLSHNELADHSHLGFCHSLQLKRLVLDLNDFTSVPPFVSSCGRLEKLSISYNSLRRVSEAALRVLRPALRRLELDHNELHALPDSLRELEQLRHLSLAYNRLEEVKELPPRLHSLSLAGNFLVSFPAALRNLVPSSLSYLDLGYNRIAYVVADQFGGWADALVTLSLRGNRIAQLSRGSFPPLALRELILNFNDLYYIEAGVFSNLTDLKVLELSSAQLSGVVSSGSSPTALKWLSLDNNDIRVVSSDDMLNFPLLEYLNLDFNKIIEFSSAASDTNVSYKLKELRLSYNYISRIYTGFLGDFSELQSVDLSYNRILNVGRRGFFNFRNLVYLNLAGNDIELVSDEAFADLPKLEVLNLQENKLAEFSMRCLSNVSNENASFAVNISHNELTKLSGGRRPVYIDILDVSHNLLEIVSREFFGALGESVRQIFLSHNKLLMIDTFSALPNLNTLSVQKNNINIVKRRLFSEIPSVQILDLSGNDIAQLSAEQFHSLHALRLLRLDGNGLRALPRDAFRNTLLEDLDLAHNRLALFPSSALAQVGFTLRRLELAHNDIEYLDAAMFHATAFLHELGLSHNALTVLSDNTLAGLPRLRRLDLSFNTIKTNFKELFHNVPRLRHLSLESTGLRSAPHLPLANLTELKLGGNRIAAYGASDVRRLRSLLALDLAGNLLTALRPDMWAALPRLLTLDVSRNPIVRVQPGCFDGLERLLHLRTDNLRHLEAIEPRAFHALKSLRSLALESPSGRAREVPLADIVSVVPHLESLVVQIRRETLDTQLLRLRAPKLRALELHGAALRRVARGALAALGGQRALTLRLTRSAVAQLPEGLLAPLARVPQLALDLSYNRLAHFGPSALYPNLTGWNRFATKLLPGGLVLTGNPLRCGCAAAWAGAWLRRWSSEVGGGARGARAAARLGTCVAGARSRPLLALPADASCGARALAAPASAPAPAPRALAACLLAALLARS